MPQPTLPASAEGLPISRRDIEKHVDALIDLLDHLDDDPDAEPSLGWREPSPHLGESANQAAAEFFGRTDDSEADDSDAEPSLGSLGSCALSGNQTYWSTRTEGFIDAEDEHDGSEPDIEEWSLGWTSAIRQDGGNWHGGCHGDLEHEHDGKEPSLGWTEAVRQSGLPWSGHPYHQNDAESTSPEGA